jgi:hypothetical protein
MLIVVPDVNVNDAGFNSAVVDASVAPTGIAAVAPDTSTHTSLGKYLNETTHKAKVLGTVIEVALPFVMVAEYLTVLG